MTRFAPVALVVAWVGCAAPRHEAPAPVPSSSAPAAPPPVRALQTPAPMETLVLADPGKPVISFRLVFTAGSVDDPPGKEGLTSLTASLLQEGGTRELSAAELGDALFPMAGELSVLSDTELTAFTGRVHEDHLEKFVKIFTDTLVQPRFDPHEFERLRTNAVNAIQNGLRGEDDETLGKVGLQGTLFTGHPYGHFVGGTVSGLRAVTLEDVKEQARQVFTQDRLVIGVAGNATPQRVEDLKTRLATLPSRGVKRAPLPRAPDVRRSTLILQKEALSTAISLGHALDLRRGDPDFYAVAFALSYLGEHRQFNGVLFRELREARGLNYGDYAYAEHFQQDGPSTFPTPNLARSQQYFSIWIRSVEPKNAIFAIRGALHFLRELVSREIPAERFNLTRGFLKGYTRLWEQTDLRRLGYAIDDRLYGTPAFLDGYRNALDKLTPAGVRQAVARHLDPERLNLVLVGADATAVAGALDKQPPTPIEYATPKPPGVVAQDRLIATEPLPFDKVKIQVRPAGTFME